jgi:hypothetical protein
MSERGLNGRRTMMPSKIGEKFIGSYWARELCHRQRVQPMQSVEEMKSVEEENTMGRGLLLWLIGIPIPIILLIWLFGGLH